MPAPSESKKKTAPDLKFEAALAELETIVRTMENGQLDLEQSITAYNRGIELMRHCQQQLADAEKQIQVLEDGALRDLDLKGETGR